MFVEGFDSVAELEAWMCPRRHVLGLLEINPETYDVASSNDKHQVQWLTEPNITARCPACGLVMEWPGCLED